MVPLVAEDEQYAARCGEAGNRLITVFVCLEASAAGGATEFPRLGLSERLAVGSALLWLNIDANGRLDGRTLHAGRPVEEGEKFGMNIWLRQRPLRNEPPGQTASASPPPHLTAAPPSTRLSLPLTERM